jgi:hypothetical protein
VRAGTVRSTGTAARFSLATTWGRRRGARRWRATSPLHDLGTSVVADRAGASVPRRGRRRRDPKWRGTRFCSPRLAVALARRRVDHLQVVAVPLTRRALVFSCASRARRCHNPSEVSWNPKLRSTSCDDSLTSRYAGSKNSTSPWGRGTPQPGDALPLSRRMWVEGEDRRVVTGGGFRA